MVKWLILIFPFSHYCSGSLVVSVWLALPQWIVGCVPAASKGCFSLTQENLSVVGNANVYGLSIRYRLTWKNK